MLSLDEMSSKDIEETQEYRNMNKELLINGSTQYAKYLGNHRWVYYLQQSVVPYVVFDGS
jgi:hypothetical protein